MYLATIHAFLLTFLHIRFGNSNDFQIFFCHRKKRKKREKKKTESRKPFKRPQPRARTRNQATVEWSQERKLFFGDATRHQRGNNFSFFPFFFQRFPIFQVRSWSKVRTLDRETATLAIPGGRIVRLLSSDTRLEIWNFYNFNFSGWDDAIAAAGRNLDASTFIR